jgi:hypothetical protein
MIRKTTSALPQDPVNRLRKQMSIESLSDLVKMVCSGPYLGVNGDISCVSIDKLCPTVSYVLVSTLQQLQICR